MTFEQVVANFVTDYGLPIVVICAITIFLIGVLKYFGVFSKIKSADVKKCIYYALDFALTFGLVAVYFAIYKLDFSGYVMYCLKTIPAVTTMYAIYENFGLRKLVKWFGTFIVTKVAKKQVEEAKDKITNPTKEEVKTETKVEEVKIIKP